MITAKLTRLKILLLAFFLNVSMSLHGEEATQDWYQIEYVLFEHLGSDRHILRYENVNYKAPLNKQYQYLYELGDALSPYHVSNLKAEKRELNDAIERLRRNKVVEVITQGAWQQIIDKESSALPLKIAAGTEFNFDRFQVEGSLTIKRSRYMHAYLDIYMADFIELPYKDLRDWYFETEETRWPAQWLAVPLAISHPALEEKGSSLLESNTYHLSASRRVKDGEIHYIDHPALGMIITIKKIDDPSAISIDPEV